MSGRPWIKQPTTRLNDARLSFVSDQAQRDYFMLYLLAGQLDADGYFLDNGRQLSDEEIAFRIHVKASRLKASLSELKNRKVGLIHVNGHGPMIADWKQEQINWREKQDADRERQARHRSVTRDGESITRDGDEVTPPDQIQNQTRPDSDSESIPTTLPSSRKKRAGRKAGSESDDSGTAMKLNKKQRARKEIIIKILASSGIRNPKLETVSTILATRSYKTVGDMIAYLLAGLASAYADPKANSKESVAAYRLENNQVPTSYEDPRRWDVIPEKVLQAAGINSLQSYITKRSMDKFMGGR